MIKFLAFYGGWALALMGTLVFLLLFRPRLRVRTSCDEAAGMIRCELRVARSFHPITVYFIWIPVEYVEALGASPPARFREEPDRVIPEWAYDGARRELVVWKGRLNVPSGTTVQLSIPARRPKALSGSLVFLYECRGLAGVGILGTWVHAPLNQKS
jgi:hypothetical protein